MYSRGNTEIKLLLNCLNKPLPLSIRYANVFNDLCTQKVVCYSKTITHL